jgi:hypothetical protein
MPERIEIGDQVFTRDGGEEVGAVRQVRRAAREIIVYVENAGDFVVKAEAIRAVHARKVILDEEKLDSTLKWAIRHAHDSEN